MHDMHSLNLLRTYTWSCSIAIFDILVGRHFRGALAGLGNSSLWNGGT